MIRLDREPCVCQHAPENHVGACCKCACRAYRPAIDNQARSWVERAAARTLPPMIVGGVAR